MRTIRFLAVLAIMAILTLVIIGQEGSPSLKSGTKFEPRIPPPPQLSADDLYGQLGRAHAQLEIQQKYITQLQQELTAAQALCQKPEAEKEK